MSGPDTSGPTWAAASPACPLCGFAAPAPFHTDARRLYLRCERCRLVFVPAVHWLTPEAEKAVYDLHENEAVDPGYRRFLSRLCDPLLERLSPGCRGLDFGCGPGPTLSRMLADRGHRMALYDPFYQEDPAVLTRTYDFITATEVVEHLRVPGRVIASLFSMLRPGGWLGIMTKLARDREAFRRWHYIRDPTHICFFSRATFRHLAQRHGAALVFIGTDVILMQKRR
jgi:SAM-dependent methyltransferase